jgi:hypothetical protein
MKINTEKGIIKTIIILVIALLILSYFGFNLRSAVEAPTTQSNFSYATNFVVNVWHSYLERPATYLWNEIFLKLIWGPAIDNLTKIKNGQPTDIESGSKPALPAARGM